MARAAIGLALGLDALLGEVPDRIHPVALFGRLVARIDREWPTPSVAGAAIAAVLPASAAALAGWFVALAARQDRRLASLLAGLALFSTTSLRMLLALSRAVVDRSESDPDAARGAVRGLVGRERADLSPGELRSAAVESAAENVADGLVAPLGAFAVGARISLPAGAAAAVWVKAVNTLDSMLGYRSKPVGRASARLDDAVMWLPARVAAVLIALAGRAPGALAAARRGRHATASPNSGWPMATLAAVLDVELRKPGAYRLNPEAELPSIAEGRRGVRIVALAGLGAFALATAVSRRGEWWS